MSIKLAIDSTLRPDRDRRDGRTGHGGTPAPGNGGTPAPGNGGTRQRESRQPSTRRRRGSVDHVPEGFHPPLEEYLESIHELGEEGIVVIQARLAERLGHSPPAVSEMIRRLREAGYVEGSGRSLTLTDLGRSKAESVVRKHRLAERLLTDIIGLPWDKAHLEAGRWEHVISDEVEARLVEILGHPTTCPHGNPIPGSGAGMPREVVVLAMSRQGDHIRLERVTEHIEIDQDSLSYLSSHGFIPGTEATVASRAPDGTLTLDMGSSTIVLGPALAEQLFVTAA
jgi:DtxR family Mn-dependent transcriptional regulator